MVTKMTNEKGKCVEAYLAMVEMMGRSCAKEDCAGDHEDLSKGTGHHSRGLGHTSPLRCLAIPKAYIVSGEIQLNPRHYLWANLGGSDSKHDLKCVAALQMSAGFGGTAAVSEYTFNVEGLDIWEVSNLKPGLPISNFQGVRFEIHKETPNCCSTGSEYAIFAPDSARTLSVYRGANSICGEPKFAECLDGKYVSKAGWGVDNKHTARFRIEYDPSPLSFFLFPDALGAVDTFPPSARFFAAGLHFSPSAPLLKGLPGRHEVLRGKLPTFRAKFQEAVLIAYANRSKSDFNVGMRSVSWENVFHAANAFMDEVRTPNSPWGAIFTIDSASFSEMYVTVLGSENSVWVLAHLRADGANTPPATGIRVRPRDPSLPAFTKPLMCKDSLTFYFGNRDGTRSRDTFWEDWACLKPLGSLCESALPEAGTVPYCTLKSSLVPETLACEKYYNSLSVSKRNTEVRNYCRANTKSTDCQCHNRGDYPIYSELRSKAPVGSVEACWWRPCKATFSQLKDSGDESECLNTVCLNIADFRNNVNLTVEDFKQHVTCNTKSEPVREEDIRQVEKARNTGVIIAVSAIILLFALMVVSLVMFQRKISVRRKIKRAEKSELA